MQNPGKAHWTAALRVLRYLRGTLSHKLHFSKSPQKALLVGFSDADHAGCPDTRRSHSGYVVKVNDTAVAWASRRQKCVALSSCESEYIAVCECAKQIVWMRRLMIELLKIVLLAYTATIRQPKLLLKTRSTMIVLST